jgi:hypothetical protein
VLGDNLGKPLLGVIEELGSPEVPVLVGNATGVCVGEACGNIVGTCVAMMFGAVHMY